MNDIMDDLREQQEELLSMVEGLAEDQLALPSACEGWSVSDVLLHLAQTNEMATASASGLLAGAADGWANSDSRVVTDVEDNVAGAVERERGASGTEILARWVKSAGDMVDALEACDPTARVRWVAGDMAPRTLATTRLAETWIHTGDVCIGLGIEQPKSDRIWHIARLAHRTLPYSFLRAGCEPTGEVRFNLTSPTDERGPMVLRRRQRRNGHHGPSRRPVPCRRATSEREGDIAARRWTRRHDRPSHRAHLRVARHAARRTVSGLRRSTRCSNVHGDSSPSDLKTPVCQPGEPRRTGDGVPENSLGDTRARYRSGRACGSGGRSAGLNDQHATRGVM